eukprot:340539-Chlamydomonas_euryale.AAC.2
MTLVAASRLMRLRFPGRGFSVQGRGWHRGCGWTWWLKCGREGTMRCSTRIEMIILANGVEIPGRLVRPEGHLVRPEDRPVRPEGQTASPTRLHTHIPSLTR